MNRIPRLLHDFEIGLGSRYSVLDFIDDIRDYGEASLAAGFDPLSWCFERYASPSVSEDRMLRYSNAVAYIGKNRDWLDAEPFGIFVESKALLREETYYTLWYIWARDTKAPDNTSPSPQEFLSIFQAIKNSKESK